MNHLKGSIGRLVSRVVDSSDVDDVTQDIFLHVFCSLGAFRFESHSQHGFIGWRSTMLFSIFVAKNIVRWSAWKVWKYRGSLP
jgi:hypothetical protein